MRWVLASVVLACAGEEETNLPTGQPATEVPYALDHRELVSLNAAPCGVDSAGAVFCWAGPSGQGRTFAPGPYMDLASYVGSSTDSWIRALRTDGSPEVVDCRLSSGGRCLGAAGPLVELLGPRSGRREDGVVVLSEVGEDYGSDWIRWSSDGPVALLDAGGRLKSNFVDEQIQDPEGVVEVATAPTCACVLRASGQVECYGPDPVELPGTFASIRGSAHGLCGLRTDGQTVDCTDGQSHDFGSPVRLFTTGDVAGNIGICVVTEDARIECRDRFGFYEGFEGELR